MSSAFTASNALSAAVILLVTGSVVVAALGLYLTDLQNHRQAPHLHHRSRLWLPTFLWVVFATLYWRRAGGGPRARSEAG